MFEQMLVADDLRCTAVEALRILADLRTTPETASMTVSGLSQTMVAGMLLTKHGWTQAACGREPRATR
jgi:hypothetical protein